MTQDSSIKRQPAALWQELVTAALLGTERRPAPLPPPGEPLGDLLGGLRDAEPERRLLAAAATVSLYQRCGELPAMDLRLLSDPCEPETLPRCSARAGLHLALMLRGDGEERAAGTAALPEWLAAVAAAGQRVPDESLPELLDEARRRPELREVIRPVLGKRGEWLVLRNPEWEHVAARYRTDDATWDTGSRGKRLAYLRSLRGEDPARARELLVQTWKDEEPKDRADFLGVFLEGLGAEDEPFLEAALDDRRKEVRRAAADLLARLPGSRLRRQMVERVRPLIALQRGMLGGSRFEITLPERCDAGMIRDGIGAESRPSGVGEKWWWLAEVVSMLPPAFWWESWGKRPAELLQAANAGESGEVLLVGWAMATARHADPEWAEALARWWYVQAEDRSLPGVSPMSFLHHVPAPRLDALVLEALEAHREPLHDRHPAFWLLRALRDPWSVPLARAVIRSVQQRMGRGAIQENTVWEVRPALKEFALRVPVALYQELSAGWPTEAKEWEAWAKSIDAFQSLLHFRREMLKELAS